MKNIIKFYNKLNISSRITLFLYLGTLIRFPYIIQKNVKISILIGIVPFIALYLLIIKNSKEFSENDKKILYKQKIIDSVYIIVYTSCLEMDLIILNAIYKPAWLATLFSIIILSIISWFFANYFTLIISIHKKFKQTRKGE